MQDAFAELVCLAERGATGEFVCVSAESEIHVHLQDGRVAWATDSASPFTFRRWLVEHTSLSLDTYLEVLEWCRLERRPIGQTLIEWRAVSPEEVRSALEFQITGALSRFRGRGTGRALFLERASSVAHDASFTFEVADVTPRSDLVERLTAEIPNATFEVLDGSGSSPDLALPASSVTDGAELIAYRSKPGTVLGVALSSRRSIWCRLDPDAAFGGPLDAICKATNKAISTPPGPPLLRLSERIGERAQLLDAIDAFQVRAPEVLGLVIAERGEPIAIVHRLSTGPRELDSLVRRRGGLLQVDEQASFMTSEKQLWCFGSRPPSSDRTLWLFLDRAATPGLGWAYLPSLERHLDAVV